MPERRPDTHTHKRVRPAHRVRNRRTCVLAAAINGGLAAWTGLSVRQGLCFRQSLFRTAGPILIARLPGRDRFTRSQYRERVLGVPCRFQHKPCSGDATNSPLPGRSGRRDKVFIASAATGFKWQLAARRPTPCARRLRPARGRGRTTTPTRRALRARRASGCRYRPGRAGARIGDSGFAQ